MLAVRDLHFSRGPRKILAGVTAELHPGRVVALLGPNGAGKSTLLKLLSGELSPESGVIELDGKPLEQWPAEQVALRRAVLPQESHLAFAFPVREVVMMGRYPHNRHGETSSDHSIVEAVMRMTETLAFAPRPYPALSSGEKQRVHLARVLAQIWERPETGHRLLLLDEPAASLDLAHQYAAMQAARHLARNGDTAVLAVLHDLNLAMEYADEVWVLDERRLLAAGPVAEVLTPALIERVFKVGAEIIRRPNTHPIVITRAKNDGAQ